MLPLLCLEGLRLLARLRGKLPLFSPDSRRPLLRTAAYAAANLLGLFASRWLPVRKHTIYTGASIFSGASVIEKLREVRDAFTTVSGLAYVIKSDCRFFFLLMFLFNAVLVLSALWLLLRRRTEDGTDACFWLHSLIACLGVLAAFFVTSVSLRAIYLFPLYFLPALSLVLIARRASPRLLYALAAVLLVLSAANLYFSYREDVDAVTFPGETDAEAACRYAVENGYELIYGEQSFTAPNVAVCSDGALIAGCWQAEMPFRVSPHINIRDVYYLADYARAIFVFSPYELESVMRETAINGVTLTFRGQFGPYHLYTSSSQLLYPITDIVDFNPRYPEYQVK